MSASNFDRPGRLAAASLLALLLAACGSGGGGGEDTRCFGVAQVPAWQIHMISSFSDAGAFDTFTVALHAAINATGTTGPVQASNSNPNGFAWVGPKPTGTIAATDTLILNSHDTLVAVASGFGPGPSTKVGPYVSVNLATCQATLGAILYSVVTESNTGHPDVTDTIIAAYPFLPGITIDSLFVANGITVPTTKVASLLIKTSFGSTGEYRVGGLASPAYDSASSVPFDSASVSWAVTPSATPAAPPAHSKAAELLTLPSGVIIPARR